MYQKHTVMDQLCYFARLRGASKQAAERSAGEWVDYFGLGEYKNKKLETLSKGNQQKIQIAQCFLNEPDILILDEPFSGLDPVNAQVFKDAISRFVREGRLVIFSSHQMGYVEEVCDDITLIHSGDILLSGNLDDIKRDMGEGKLHVAVMDFGIKRNILKSIEAFGCRLTVFPASATAEEVLACDPDGIFLSNGPGDPKDLPEVIENIKKLIGKKPIFGICLGHQLMALANGADTYKMKFGHRGINQPVKYLATGRIYISAQNHGYAVDEKSLEGKGINISHISMNDGTIEGLEYTKHPTFTVQYHPEACPGPGDHDYLFKHFVDMMEGR